MINLGRSGVRRERESLHATSPKVGNKIGVSALRIVLFAVIALAVTGMFFALGAYEGVINNAPSISDANIMPLGYASFVYDKDGTQIQKLNSVEGNRISVGIDEIPLDMQHAIVAIEDSRFYEHNGVDPHGMIRAIMVMVQSGFSSTEGASTITQQLLKNNVFTGWLNESRLRQITRKLQEQYLAVQLEKSLREAGQDPKAVILENYLNTVNFGSGAYGVQTAAQTYFGKDASELTLSECAVLAAIPQNPSQYNPFIYPEENEYRMHTVLDYMLSQGYITSEEHDAAMKDAVYDRIMANEESGASQITIYSYFVDELIEQVKLDLMAQKGYTEAEANTAIYNGGLKIYSTENQRIQKIMEEEFADPSNYPEDTIYSLDWALSVTRADGSVQNYSVEMLMTWYRENVEPALGQYFMTKEDADKAIAAYKEAMLTDKDEIIAERTDYIAQPQACMTIIDQSNGHVVGIIGGRGEKTGSLTLNRAVNSFRQPGNALEILSTYGPALENGLVTLATTESEDDSTTSDDTDFYQASAAGFGDVTVREAIANTNELAAIKVLSAVTPQTAFQYLTNLGITSLVEDSRYDLSPILATGNTTNGVSNLEFTAAYAAIANNGTYNKPIFYTKVTDRQGNVILDNTQTGKQVFRPSTCYLLIDAMEDIMTVGNGVPYQIYGGTQAVGDQGTTKAMTDVQFIGFTPYYTAGIWTGYDTNLELKDTEQQYSSLLWSRVMNRIHEGLEAKTFERPANIQEVTVCRESGLIAGVGCQTVTDIFDSSTAPTKVCTEHMPIVTPTPRPVYTTPTPAPQSAEDVGGSNVISDILNGINDLLGGDTATTTPPTDDTNSTLPGNPGAPAGG